MSKAGKRLIAALQEAIAISRGEAKLARIHTPEEILAARARRLAVENKKTETK
jgi:hypothetical protein